MIYATREQLAAILVENEDAALVAHGTPGNWSLAVSLPTRDAVWLTSERRKSAMRSFKNLDSLHNQAMAVYRTAFPISTDIVSVTIKHPAG